MALSIFFFFLPEKAQNFKHSYNKQTNKQQQTSVRPIVRIYFKITKRNIGELPENRNGNYKTKHWLCNFVKVMEEKEEKRKHNFPGLVPASPSHLWTYTRRMGIRMAAEPSRIHRPHRKRLPMMFFYRWKKRI